MKGTGRTPNWWIDDLCPQTELQLLNTESNRNIWIRQTVETSG